VKSLFEIVFWMSSTFIAMCIVNPVPEKGKPMTEITKAEERVSGSLESESVCHHRR
jgi:hypothetical protein